MTSSPVFGLRGCVLMLAALSAACGDDIDEPVDPGEPPGAGVGSSTGSGPQPCDGSDASCFGFCNTNQTCGEGVCLSAPLQCTGECDGVCGCDGNYYCNACLAHSAFVDVEAGATCPLPSPSSSAWVIGPEPVRLVLIQYDPVEDVCVQLVLSKGAEGPPFDATISAPWSIETAVATDHALDCVLPCGPTVPPMPVGEVANPVAITGNVDIPSGELPGDFAAELTLIFEGVDWVAERSISVPLTTPPACF